MRPTFVRLSCAAAIAIAAITPRSPAHGALAPDGPHDANGAAARAVEVRRIQAHFDSVLAELPSRDVTALSAAQRARRAALMSTLRAYRDRGVFPHNYDFPGAAVPYFVDRKTGTLCAVAHLLASTGRRDVVDRVAQLDNNVWVAELAGDTAFGAWLDDEGLSLAEAARIQVPYMDDGSSIVGAFGSRSNAYVAGAALTVASSSGSALWQIMGNKDGRRTLANIVGVTTGTLAMGFGGLAMSDRDAPPATAVLSLVAGGVSTFLSTRGFLRHRQYVAAQREARSRGVARASVSPMLPVAGQNGAGLMVNVRF